MRLMILKIENDLCLICIMLRIEMDENRCFNYLLLLRIYARTHFLYCCWMYNSSLNSSKIYVKQYHHTCAIIRFKEVHSRDKRMSASNVYFDIFICLYYFTLITVKLT